MSQDFDHQILQRHAFGVFDATIPEDLPEGICSAVMVPPDLAASAHLMPRLIDLRSMPQDQQDVLLECLYRCHIERRPPPIAVLVDTDIYVKEFTDYWNAMQMVAPQPGRRAWLRVHDSRVLYQLLRMLNPAQRRKLFGKSRAFTYWIAGEWRTELSGDPLPDDVAARWDWARIERIGAINRALHGAGVREAVELPGQSALAEQLIERAGIRHGLVSQADVVEFAVRGLSTCHAFDEHPDVASRLSPGADPDEETTLADRLALIDDSIWNKLRPPIHTQ